MGCTALEVARYEKTKDPSHQLLFDWGRKKSDNNIKKLMSLLSELDRIDILSDIQSFLGLSDSNLKSTEDRNKGERVRTESADEDIPLVTGDSNGQSFRMLQVDTQESSGRQSAVSQRSGSASSQRDGVTHANEGVENGSRSSIRVESRGASGLTMMEEGVGYSANVGVTLNRVEGSSQSACLTDHITPVE